MSAGYGDPIDRKDEEITALKARCQELDEIISSKLDESILNLSKGFDQAAYINRLEAAYLALRNDVGYEEAREALEAIKRGD